MSDKPLVLTDVKAARVELAIAEAIEVQRMDCDCDECLAHAAMVALKREAKAA